MANQDHPIHRRVGVVGVERISDSIQGGPELGRRSRDLLAGGIEEDPELKASGNLRVVFQLVHVLEERLRAREEAMDEHDGNLSWLVGPEKIEPGLHARPLEIGIEESGHLQRREALLRDLDGHRGGSVARQGDVTVAQVDRPVEEGVAERQGSRPASPVLAFQVARSGDHSRGGDAKLTRMEPIQGVRRPGRLDPSMGDQRSSEPVVAVNMLHPLDADILHQLQVGEPSGGQVRGRAGEDDPVVGQNFLPAPLSFFALLLGDADESGRRPIVNLLRRLDLGRSRLADRQRGQ